MAVVYNASACLVGGCVAAPAGYLAVLSAAAAVGAARPAADPSARPRLAVIVPAHDEEALLGRCLRSLSEQTYPSDRFVVVVVADNCGDRTAEVADSWGVRVLERRDEDRQGKGYALRWATDRVLVEYPDVAACVVVDADSVADPGLLAALAACFAGGAPVVQAEYLALTDADAGARALLRDAAFLLFHRVRFSGRAALRLPCSLVGNGMLLSRTVLEQHPWNAFGAAEDLEYSVELRRSGIRPVFEPRAGLRAPVAAAGHGAAVQRSRWEVGRLRVIRAMLPELVRAGSRRSGPRVWDVVVDLVVPPLGVLASLAALGTVVTAAIRFGYGGSPWPVVVWVSGSVAVAVHVLVGLRAAGAPAATFLALAAAPRLIVGELCARVSMLRRPPTAWERTDRPGDAVATVLRAVIPVGERGKGP